MKYDVLVRKDEKQCQLVVRNECRGYYNDHIETEEFNPQDWAEKNSLIEVYRNGMTWGTYQSPSVKLEEKTRLKEWIYFKTIEIDSGELRAGDYYEVNGKKCRFEIVYNNKTDKVELRVDYTDEIVEHELNEMAKAKFKEYQRIKGAIEKEYKRKKDAEAMIRAMLEEDRKDEERKNKRGTKTERGFFERLFR